MFVTGIPSNMIVSEATRRDRDYELEFVNTDSNSDLHTLRVFLRNNQDADNRSYKVRMQLVSGILAYPSFEAIWKFSDSEYSLASDLFQTVCNKVDEIHEEFNRSMAPVSIVAPKLREAMKLIAENRREKMNNLPLDEIKYEQGVSDWRSSIYSNRYPNMSQAEKDMIQKFEGSHVEQPFRRRRYRSRGRY